MALEFLSIFCMINNDGNKDEDSPDEKHLKDRRRPRIALCRHHQSTFIYLFNSGNKQALLNCCGVDHKVFSTIADYGIYDQVQKMFDEYGAMVTVDLAFKVRLTNYLIQSLQSDPVDTEALVLNREATLLWQLSEFLLEDFGDQNVTKVIHNVGCFHNYQTSTVGHHNQILNVFMHKKVGYFSHADKPTKDIHIQLRTSFLYRNANSSDVLELLYTLKAILPVGPED
eukprot:jgi/Psemu1/14415/gm1.14415_g